MSNESALAILTGEPTPQSPGLAPAEPVETQAPPTLDSDRFAKIAAREQKLQKERETFKSEQQRLYEEKKKLTEVQTQLNEFQELKAKDPIQALKKIGFTEEDIFNFMASKDGEEPTPEQKAAAAADARIKEFEDKQLKQQQEELKKRDSQVIKSFKDTIGKTITKEAEKYEYCNHYGEIAQELIYDHILSIYKQEPDILPHVAMKEAIETIEEFYEKEDQAMNALKKRQPKPQTGQTQTPLAKEVPLKAQVNPKPNKIAPITNKAAASVASVSTGKETSEQKRARLENWLRTGQKS